MKKSQFLINSLFVFMGFFLITPDAIACKRKKKKTVEAQKVANMKADTIRLVRAPGSQDQVSLDSLKKAKMKLKRQASASNMVISFTSKGEGIDRKAFAEFESFIKKYKPTSECKFEYNVKSWGREGEKDYCITSSYSECMVGFQADVQKLFKGNDRVLIQEQTFCRE